MQGPLVSVVMPAYNAANTIAGAVLGIVNQRYANWELIIVDDGSTEQMEGEVKQFDDKRIRFVRLSRNRGLANALNVGLSSARGRFIARMDSDDYMEEWRIGDQVRHIMMHGLAICGTGADKFGIESGEIRSPMTGPAIINSFLTGNPFVHPTVMLDRERLGREMLYNDSFRCEEDYELWSRCVTATNSGNLDYSTIKYRVTASSNANHPQKKRLNKIAIFQFATRLGVADIAPIDELSELQIAGYVDAPSFQKMKAYAQVAESKGLPKLGWVHGPVLDFDNYYNFFTWFNDVRSFIPYKY